MAREDRKKRRAEARKRREERQAERQYVMGLIQSEYEAGDDADALREKVEPILRQRARGDGELLMRLFDLFIKYLPILLKLFIGI